MDSTIKKPFRWWKITLAIVLGLSVSTGMLYYNLSKTQFVQSSPGEGDYIWVDGNSNARVDLSTNEDFQQNAHGNYRKKTINEVLSEIEWSQNTFFWLAIAILFMVSRDFFYVVRIRLLTKNQLGWKAATYVILLWEFASALTPGVVGGAAVAMFILNRETVPFGKATAIVIITAFMDNLFFVLMIPFVFLFIHASDLFPDTDVATLGLKWVFWMGFAVIFSVCLLLYLSLFWFPNLATRFLLFLFRFPLIKRWKFIAIEWGKDIERAAKSFQNEPFNYWLKVFLATFLSWMSRYLVINAILNAFIELGFIENIRILGKQLILWIIMLVSPTPGGSGVAEFAFGELLGPFSTSLVLITVLGVLWRLISYFPYLFIGVILLPTWIKRTQR